MTMRRQDESGQALPLALGFLVFFGLVIAATLSFATSSMLATQRLREDRAILYAADGATDGAIQFARGYPAAGAFGASPCITFSAALDGVTATVTCKSLAAPTDLDRTVEFTASVGGVDQVRAKVKYYDSAVGVGGTPAVDVLSWTILG
jgi:hypothetical protein